MEKVLLIICDGYSDRPIYELSGKTPLEAARKPNLNKLLKRSMTGLMHTVDIGVRPGSDVAHLSLFGYDINKYYTGRGPYEAAGYGLEMKKGDVALRGNFASVDSKMTVIERRAQRVDNTEKLVAALDGIIIDGVKINVAKGIGHRAVVVLRGKDLDGRITDVDPHIEKVKILSSKPKIKNTKAQKTARVVNKFVKLSFQILSGHPFNKNRIKKGLFPANIMLLRGAGSLPSIPSFKKKYGFNPVCIAGGGLYKGIAKLLGFDILNLTSATGKPDTDINAKLKAALASLNKYNFVFVHIKGTDVLSEDGNFIAKKKFIEKIDLALKPLVERNDILIVFTGDHTTSSYLKIHTADPVPVLIAGNNLHVDKIDNFSEREAGNGKLGHIQGKHLMPIIKDLIGKAPLLGA